VGAAVVFRTSDVSLQPRPFLRWVGERGITVLDLPTAYWHELAGAEIAFPECVRLVIVGGEKASPAAYRTWRRFTGDRIRWINTYGPTEASIIATAYEPVGRDPEDLSELPIGRPIANVQIHIPDGEIGEMYIAGAGVARGYLNHPELTAERFVNGMYRTGDLGRRLPDGNIEFCGRTDLQIKIRGFRVEPGEIEAVLERHAGVRQACVIASERGLIAYAIPAHRELPDLREALKDGCPST
jgi:aspartate racemase